MRLTGLCTSLAFIWRDFPLFNNEQFQHPHSHILTEEAVCLLQKHLYFAITEWLSNINF